MSVTARRSHLNSRRPAHLEIPDVPLPSSCSKSSPSTAASASWVSPCSIIHGFPDSPLPSPAAAGAPAGADSILCPNSGPAAPGQYWRPRFISRLQRSTEVGSAYSYSAPASPSPLNNPAERRPAAREVFRVGTFVLVRCNQTKWLLGKVRRWTNAGVIVWVGSVQVMVNVPYALLSTHLARIGDMQPPDRHSSEASIQNPPPPPPPPPSPPPPPPPPTSVSCPSSPRLALPVLQAGLPADQYSPKLLAPFYIVRPAHLSHRQLYKALTQSHPPRIAHCNPTKHLTAQSCCQSPCTRTNDCCRQSFHDRSPKPTEVPPLPICTSQPSMSPNTYYNHHPPPLHRNRPPTIPPQRSPRVHKPTLLRSFSLPSSQAQIARICGEQFQGVRKEEGDPKPGPLTPTNMGASCNRSTMSNEDQGIQALLPERPTVLTRCKSLDHSDKGPPEHLHSQEVWYTVIENGLHTRKKRVINN